MVEIFRISSVYVSLGVGFRELRARLCLPCQEAGLPLGWGAGAAVYRPLVPPSTAPWGSQRKASSEGCKPLFKCYAQSHIYV